MPDVTPTFDDLAVALAMAASKLKLDLEQTELLAARIEMTPMGVSLGMAELRRNLDLVVKAHQFFKDNAAIEAQVRAAARRRPSWLSHIVRGSAAL